MRYLIIMVMVLIIPATVAADCYDFSIALPGQTFVIKGDNPNEMKLFFGESQSPGWCPRGDARLEWTETLPSGHALVRTLPLTYETREGSEWILIPNLALCLFVDGTLMAMPLNTPMLEWENEFSDSKPIPWGSW